MASNSLFNRWRDRGGQDSRDKNGRTTPPPSPNEPPPSRRRSDPGGDRPRSAPVDLQAVEFFYREGRNLKEARSRNGFDEVLQASMETVCNTLGAERAAVFLTHSGGSELISHVMAGAGSTSTIIIPSDQGIAGEVLRFGTALVVNDLSDRATFYAELEKMTGIRALNILAAPLKDAIGNTFGVFQATNKPGGFTASDQALILPYVSALSDALQPRKPPAA